MDILQKQYALLQSSRGVVFDFLQTQIGDDLMNTPVPAYDNKTIRYLLEHIASCHFNWLAYFALQQPSGSLNEEGFTTTKLIRQLYGQVDDTMAVFLENFKDKMEVPINGIHSACGQVSATPLQVFTHVLTHEFHHKGQILSMCRLLGHIPPDTDISCFFQSW